MRRRGWSLFQAGACLVLLLVLPRALRDAEEGLQGPYGGRAAPLRAERAREVLDSRARPVAPAETVARNSPLRRP
ncbi:MAG: hypothetical protein AB1726_06065 [Planctomycetota bacterium]